MNYMTEKGIKVTGPAIVREEDRKPEDAKSFADAYEAVQVGIATLNFNEGDIGELVDGVTPAPHTIGQLLMACIALSELPTSRLPPEQKRFWLQVAEFIGPDYIRELRRIAAFMDKMDQF